MAYTETTRTSYGQRVKNSFGGIVSGILLIIIGTVLLWWNEGRAVKTTRMLKEAAGVTVEMQDISKVDPQFEGKLVHATGATATLDSLVDPDFGVGARAVKFNRKVEYYQWKETSQSTSKDKVGGSQETTTTYYYDKAWTSSPVNSEDFHDPSYKGRNTVKARFENSGLTAENVTFGAYRLNKPLISSISGEQDYIFSEADAERISKELFKDATEADSTFIVSVKNNVVYFGQNPDAPAVGDVRITFTEVLPAEVSILATVLGDTFAPFTAKNGRNFEILAMGAKTSDQMYEGQHSTNKMILWIVRILGIILVIGGFKNVFGFLETLAKVLPFVANILGAGIGLICSVVGFAWSFVVIALAWVAYRPVLGIALLVIAGALVWFLVSKKKKAAPAAQ